MKTIVSSVALALLLSVSLRAQTIPAPTAAAGAESFLSTLTSTNTLVLAGMAASQLADAKTDWQFALGGKTYRLTPAQRLGIAGGIFGACLAIEQAVPKSKKWVDVAGTVVMAYFAGRALANTYNHGTQAAAPSTAAVNAARGSGVAFGVRLH